MSQYNYNLPHKVLSRIHSNGVFQSLEFDELTMSSVTDDQRVSGIGTQEYPVRFNIYTNSEPYGQQNRSTYFGSSIPDQPYEKLSDSFLIDSQKELWYLGGNSQGQAGIGNANLLTEYVQTGIGLGDVTDAISLSASSFMVAGGVLYHTGNRSAKPYKNSPSAFNNYNTSWTTAAPDLDNVKMLGRGGSYGPLFIVKDTGYLWVAGSNTDNGILGIGLTRGQFKWTFINSNWNNTKGAPVPVGMSTVRAGNISSGSAIITGIDTTGINVGDGVLCEGNWSTYYRTTYGSGIWKNITEADTEVLSIQASQITLNKNTVVTGINTDMQFYFGNFEKWKYVTTDSTNSVGYQGGAVAAIRDDNTLWAWGNNTNGLLGIGTTNPVTPSPTRVGVQTFSSVALSQYYIAALTHDGEIWAAGSGIGITLTKISNDTDWTEVKCGSGIIALKGKNLSNRLYYANEFTNNILTSMSPTFDDVKGKLDIVGSTIVDYVGGYVPASAPFIGVNSGGTFNCVDIKEGPYASIPSNVPVRFGNNDDLKVYDSIDEHNPPDDMFGDLIELSKTLNGVTVETTSGSTPTYYLPNKEVVGHIHNQNSAFNVFAIAGRWDTNEASIAEDLQEILTSNGKSDWTSHGKGFLTNTSNNRILSTGKTIKGMTGIMSRIPKHNYYIPAYNTDIDKQLMRVAYNYENKKWMAMAVFDNTNGNYLGLMVWLFSDSVFRSSNSSQFSYNQPFTTASGIFHLNSFTDQHRLYAPLVIDPNGNIIDVSATTNMTNVNAEPRSYWSFSKDQNAGSSGYYTQFTGSDAQLNVFSQNNGVWAFSPSYTRAPNYSTDQLYADWINGSAIEYTSNYTSNTKNGYGFGVYETSDSVSSQTKLYWDGVDQQSTAYTGFIFTGDG